MNHGLAHQLRAYLAVGEPAVLVTLERARGSTPREAGAAMLVGRAALHGTVGGGRLEWEAVARARELLASGGVEERLELPLGPAVGQCCGGHVALRLRRAGPAELADIEAAERDDAATWPQVLVFGAGHVGRALVTALAPLPLQVRWVDERAAEFPAVPPSGIVVAVTDALMAEVEAAPANAAFFVLTHSHALDFEVCAAVLERGEFAYLGLIGSATKRARFEHGLRELGIPDARLDRLVCPIGGRLRDKRPPVIAALAAAELLVRLAAGRDR